MSSRVYASIIFLLACSSLFVNGHLTIFMNNNGYDKETCVTDSQEESTPCKTLHYVLNELSLTQLETKDVTIIVENSQTIQSIDISYGFELNITVFGVGQPSLSCVDNGYLHFSSEENINVDITFDGITFKNCNRHELQNDEWITGYAVLNFNMVTLRNVIVTNSSDIFFRGNKLVLIENCWFHDNVYRFGLVYISLTDSNNVMSNGTKTNSYTITYTNFSDNIALLGNHSQFAAVIGGIVTTTKQDLSIYFHISNCLFENNQGVNQDLNFEDTKLAEIVLNITNASLDNLGILIQESMFTNHSDLELSSTIQVICIRSSYNTFSSNIISNTFLNNLGGGEIVAFHLQDISASSLPTEILYETNNASYNIGDCLRVFFSNVSSPKMVTIRNSTFVKNHGKAIRASCVYCSKHVATFNLSFIEASENKVLNLQTGVVDITRSTVYMASSTFSDNIGTAVYVKDVIFYVDGQILFERNAGTYGGGLAMIGNTQFFVRNVALIFVDNLALYGGGIYNGILTYEGQVDICTAIVIQDCDVHFIFENNTASSSGNNAFFVDSALAGCIGEFIYDCFQVNITEIGYGSSAVTIKGIYGNSGADTLMMFPGQNLVIDSIVYDAFFRLDTCEAAVYLQCEKQVITCRNDSQFIQLDGPTLITIGSLTYTSNVKLLASKNISNSTFSNPSLRFKCPYTQTYTLYLDIIDCPVGFVYNKTTSACQCVLQNSNPFFCSLPHGIVCVEEGFWLGNIKGDNEENVSIVSMCHFGTYCNTINTIPCPNIADQRGASTDSYVLVGLSEDDQCNSNRGGILCSYCREGATFTYEGILCISNDKCKPWHPYALLTLAILFQMILAYVIQLFLSSHTLPHGIGFLFGPLFYLAVVDNLFYIYYVDFYSLRLLISIFTSVFHLNLEIFGQIRWCFFSTLNPLENYAFHYLGPLMVSIIVAATILLSRKCPKLQKYLYISPIQTICLLFLMSFWSLNNIFSQVFQGVEFSGSKHKHVAVHPELRYFTGSHIPLAIISGFFCICGAFPFILVLLLAPFVSKKISLYRIQPFLDQFQSSYKDNFRWYPSVYMIGWVIILVLRRQPLITQIVLTIMLLAFIIFRPYSTKWLNIANGLLLLDSVTIVGLLNSEEHLASDDYVWIWVNPLLNALIHLLTILPLLYIVCGMMWMVIMRFKIDYYLKKKFWPKRFRSFRKKSNDSQRSLKNLKQLSNRRKISHQDVSLNSSNELFREPLMDMERTVEESSTDNYESDYTHIIA